MRKNFASKKNNLALEKKDSETEKSILYVTQGFHDYKVPILQVVLLFRIQL